MWAKLLSRYFSGGNVVGRVGDRGAVGSGACQPSVAEAREPWRPRSGDSAVLESVMRDSLISRSPDMRRAYGSAVSSGGGWHPPLENGDASTRHMPIQRRGTAPDLPGDFGGRHYAGCQHCPDHQPARVVSLDRVVVVPSHTVIWPTRPSDDHWHRLDRWCGDLPIPLRIITDPQRLDMQISRGCQGIFGIPALFETA